MAGQGNTTKHLLYEPFSTGILPRLDATYQIDMSNSQRYPRMLHMHKNQLEMFYAHTGAGQYIVDGQQYEIQAGDFVICNAGILHGEDPFSSRQLLSYCCAMTDVHLHGLAPNQLTLPGDDPIVHCGSLSGKIGQMMELIYLLAQDKEHMLGTCTSMSISVLLLLHQLIRQRNQERTPRQAKTTDALVSHIKAYLDEHYNENISLQSLGQALHMNPYYISHVFKRETGYAPLQYVMHRRMGEAQSLLQKTLLPVAEVAETIGYNNHCHFNAMFTKYVGTSPGQYRRSLIDEYIWE
ncbi:helix-turn-helix transcriptional regulator [Intestinibacillus massiliensis]